MPNALFATVAFVVSMLAVTVYIAGNKIQHIEDRTLSASVAFSFDG